jgi:hypothetical protein
MSGRKPTIAGMDARRRPAVLGVAVGGVLAGHWLTYLTVSPTSHAREALLHYTGHAYLGLANDVGLLVVLAAFAAIFLGRLTANGFYGGASITRRIVGFQVGAFLAMEVLERITAGAPLTALAHHLLLPIGIALQIGVGLVASAAIRWLLRLADHVASVIAMCAAAPARPMPAFALPGDSFVPVGRELFAAGVRGPPTYR